MKRVQAGFTLIELLIVVAIIGILASVAIPAYQTYVARAQISEAFTMVDGTRIAIQHYAETSGAYPGAATSPSAASMATAGRYGSASVTPGTGVIKVTMRDAGAVSAVIANVTVTLTPPQDLNLAGNSFVFTCVSTAARRFLPRTCSGT